MGGNLGGPSDLAELVGPSFLSGANAISWGPASPTMSPEELTSRVGFCGSLLREQLRLKQEPTDQRLNELGLASDDVLWDLAREQFDAAYSLLEQGDWEPALEALHRGETNCPADFFSQYYLGVLTLYGKTDRINCIDLPAAEKHFRAAAEGAQRLLPKLPWGWTYAVWGTFHASVACYAQAVDIRYPLGDPYRERLRLTSALDLAEQATKLEPAFAEGHYQAARCAALLQRGDVAAPHLRAAATSDPIWLLRAECDADFDAVRSEVQTVARQMREELRLYVQWAASSLEHWMAEETDLRPAPAWPEPTAEAANPEPPSDLWWLHQTLTRALDQRTYLAFRRAAREFNEALAPRFFTPTYGPAEPDPAADLAAHVYARAGAVSLLSGTEQIGRLTARGAEIARGQKSALIGVEHVLLGLLAEVRPAGPGPVWDVQILGVKAADAAARLRDRLEALPEAASAPEPYAPPATLRLLEDACAEAADRAVGPQHLLIAINRRGNVSQRWIIDATGIQPDRIALLARPPDAPQPPARLTWPRLHLVGDERTSLGSPNWTRPLSEITSGPVKLWTPELAIHLRVRLRSALLPLREFAQATFASEAEDLTRLEGGLTEVEQALDSAELGETIRAYLRTWSLLGWCEERAAHSEDDQLAGLTAAHRAWQVAHAPAASWHSRRNVSRGLSWLGTYALFGLPASAGLAVIVNTLLGDLGVFAGGRWQEMVPRTALLLFLLGGAIALVIEQRNQAKRLREFEASFQTGEQIANRMAVIHQEKASRATRLDELAAMLRGGPAKLPPVTNEAA